MPCSTGRVVIMYNSVRKPGISMVNQAMRPGMFRTLSTDVLPMPYHGMIHCTALFCRSCQWCHMRQSLGWVGRPTYQREEVPDEQHEVVVLLGGRIPVLDKGHGGVSKCPAA